MPRAKRSKLVTLSKVQKDPSRMRDKKASQLDIIRQSAQRHAYTWLLAVSCMRNTHLKEVRDLWKGSRLVYGGNKVTRLALGGEGMGRDEVAEGISAVGERLSGPVAVLFTDTPPAEVQEWFGSYSRVDFARAGNVVDQDIVLEAGPVQTMTDPPAPLPHSIEPQLRALGMPTELKRGVPTLLRQFEVCKAGKEVSKESAQILKHLSVPLSKFRLIPLSYWTNPSPTSDEGISILAGGANGKGKGKVVDVELSAEDKSTVKREKAGILDDKERSRRRKELLLRRKRGDKVALVEADEDADVGGDDDDEMDDDEEEEDVGEGAEEDDDEESDDGDKVGAGMMLPKELR